MSAAADAEDDSSGDLNNIFNTLITASHILHNHHVLDAYGHISVRSPHNPETFFMVRDLAPALVASADDLVEYRIDDAEPVYPSAPPGYLERCIHSEILKRFPGVNSVVHSHSSEVLPYCISNVPLRPTIHMAGFLGTGVPVWDITPSYDNSDPHDLLVRTTRLGSSLAASFTKSTPIYTRVGTSLVSRITGHRPPEPHHNADYSVVLMRGHGFTTAAASIEQAVYQAVYTQAAANAQTRALMISTAYFGESIEGKVDEKGEIRGGNTKPSNELKYLTEQEARDAWNMNRASASRSWRLWVREVERSTLYENELRNAGQEMVQ